MTRSYSELILIPTFEGRYEYLKTTARIGDLTFNGSRWLNQMLYTSRKWRSIRNQVILRDLGCDLAFPGYEIFDRATVHHMNPISIKDVEEDAPHIYDSEFLITTSSATHDAIHFGSINNLPILPKERTPNDTRLW
jgi:hypothetical protein